MMKNSKIFTIIIITLIGGLIGRSLFAQPKNQEDNKQATTISSSGYVDYENTDISTLSGDIVLFFHADRCPTCRQAEKNFLKSGIPEGLTIVKVDYDKEKELKKKYSILTQTSFVYVKPDGTMLKRWVGGLTIDDILSKIQEAKGSENSNTPQRVASDVIAKAYVAGGCFRCMEGPFESLDGVKDAIAGYIGGSKDNATYSKVSSGKTQHRESVEILYDPALVTYEEILDQYRRQIDPTDAGGQFADRGSQYRTAIYYSNETEKQQAIASKKKIEESAKFEKAIVVEILPATDFYRAEDYHQDYYKKNADAYSSYKKGSGRADYIAKQWEDDPLLVKSRKDREPRKIEDLSDSQRKILFEGGTETPFDNAYRDNHAEGIYVDVIDGTPLFSSQDKFDSDTGRPSFTKPIDLSMVGEQSDKTAGIQRTEITSSSSSGHLGHIFDDGPKDKGGMRYCINSAALDFVPLDQFDAKGYSEFKKLFAK